MAHCGSKLNCLIINMVLCEAKTSRYIIIHILTVRILSYTVREFLTIPPTSVITQPKKYCKLNKLTDRISLAL